MARLLIGAALGVAIGIVLGAALGTHAQPFTPDDTLQAIEDAYVETGVSRAWIKRIVGCETGWTFRNDLVGRAGELGAAQLHPRGELLRFRAWGFTDPTNPYESVRFLALRLAQGGARAWSCR